MLISSCLFCTGWFDGKMGGEGGELKLLCFFYVDMDYYLDKEVEIERLNISPWFLWEWKLGKVSQYVANYNLWKRGSGTPIRILNHESLGS